MTIDDIIFSQPISAIWTALGGDAPRRGRARAFYRKGDNPDAVSLNDEKGCWHDFVTGDGGGVLDLVQHVLGCDRASALHWLSAFTGLPLDDRPLTQAERRAHDRRRKQIEQLARDVADWERGLELFLENRQKGASPLVCWLYSVGVDPGEVFADAARRLMILKIADADSLVHTYRHLPEAVRRPFRDSGRRDREHAEAITHAIVSILMQVSSNKAAAA